MKSFQVGLEPGDPRMQLFLGFGELKLLVLGVCLLSVLSDWMFRTPRAKVSNLHPPDMQVDSIKLNPPKKKLNTYCGSSDTHTSGRWNPFKLGRNRGIKCCSLVWQSKNSLKSVSEGGVLWLNVSDNPCWSCRDIQWGCNMISFANPALPSNFIWHCLEVFSKPRGHELIPHTYRHGNSSTCLATSETP